MKPYSRIIFSADEALAEALTPALFTLGCEGIEEKAGGERIAWFSRDAVPDARLFLEARNIRCTVEEVEARDWHAEWKKNLKPVQLTETFWVAPCWLLGNLQGRKTILIEPKMAFGTGHHETTRMCALYLEKYASGMNSLLDVGTGSGLLAILGEKLGLHKIIALDNDATVRENIEENLQQNGCSKISAYIGTLDSLDVGAGFDIITANIISSVIIPMLPALHARMHGSSKLVLSGLLGSEKETIVKLLEDNDFVVVNDNSLGEWWSVVAEKV